MNHNILKTAETAPKSNQGTSHASDANSGNFRYLPYNIEAEKALLGAILQDNRHMERVSDFLQSKHFALSQHGVIFESCSRIIEKGQIANPITLHGFFERDKRLNELGSAEYLEELILSAINIINPLEYGKIIHDNWMRRELISIGEDVVNRAYDTNIDKDAVEQLEQAESELHHLAETNNREGGFQNFRTSIIQAVELAQRAHKTKGALSGVDTGLLPLNRILGGLQFSDLLILAARPAMGKTALAVNIASNAASLWHHSNGEKGGMTAFFSLEMSADQLAARVISSTAKIPGDQLRKGQLDNDSFQRMAIASQDLYDTPLFIDDTPALTIDAIRSRARRLNRQNARNKAPGLGLIVVDYIQLISGSKRTENRVQEISEVTRGLKTLAKDLNVPVLAISQLSRAVESRDDKRPQLSDLRESGSIEQDADVVMFLYREEYYLQNRAPSEADERYEEKMQKWQTRMDKIYGKADVIIAKNRHGPTARIELDFDKAYSLFSYKDERYEGYFH